MRKLKLVQETWYILTSLPQACGACRSQQGGMCSREGSSYLRVQFIAQQGFVEPAKMAGSGLRSLEVKYCYPAKELWRQCASHADKPIILKPRTVLVLLFLGGITVCDSRGSNVTSLGYNFQGCVHTSSSAQVTLGLDACSSTSIATVNLRCDLKPSTERGSQPEAQLKHLHNKIPLSQNL